MNLVNLTNSPYPITMADGKRDILPARGRLDDIELCAAELQQIKLCGYIKIEDGSPVAALEPETQTEPQPNTKRNKRRRS